MLALLCVVSDMTMALIDAAHDKDAETKEVISTALFELGKKKPLLVLSACPVSYTHLTLPTNIAV